MRPDHNITWQDMVDHVLGEATPDTDARVNAHAAEPAIAAPLAAIRALVDALRAADQHPPRSLRDRARHLFQLGTAALPPGFQGIDLAIAQLVEDTRDPAAALGFRGEAVAYQLCFDADFAEVHLHVTADPPEACHVRGQVDIHQPAGHADIAVSFRRTGRDETFTTTVDDTGHFKLQLPPATYDLIVTIGDRTLLVPAVEIG